MATVKSAVKNATRINNSIESRILQFEKALRHRKMACLKRSLLNPTIMRMITAPDQIDVSQARVIWPNKPRISVVATKNNPVNAVATKKSPCQGLRSVNRALSAPKR